MKLWMIYKGTGKLQRRQGQGRKIKMVGACDDLTKSSLINVFHSD